MTKHQDLSLADMLQESERPASFTQVSTGKNQGYMQSDFDFTYANDNMSKFQVVNKSIPMAQFSFIDLHVKENNLLVRDTECELGINITFQLSGQLHSNFNCLEKPLAMKKGWHTMLYTIEPGGQHLLRAGDTLEIFHLSVSLEVFRKFLDANEKWGQQILERIERKQAFVATDTPMPITPAMISAIAALKNCSLKEHVQQLFREAKIIELLSLQIDQMLQQIPLYDKQPLINKGDMEKLFAVKEYIDMHFLQDLSITYLSKKFALNEFKLKKGFKLLFNKPVFSYMQESRMNYAKLLLLEKTRNVNEVADLLGYINANHFSTAFKKHFGSNPSALLK